MNLKNPRARLSRTETKGRIFSCLGELLWYLSGTNSLRFITYYIKRYRAESDDGKTVHGAYGPRLFKMHGDIDQVANIRQLLKAKPDSRRAVIQLFDAKDTVGGHREIPCTCTLQFIQRNGNLHMFTHMRSNDAFVGLPHDVFAFTMLQEMMARSLGLRLGVYKHAVGSLHLYESDAEAAKQFLDEGIQETIAMPEMPQGNPWPVVRAVLASERKLRNGHAVDVGALDLHSYWADLVRLLEVYASYREGNAGQIAKLMRRMSSDVYDPYIRQKHRTVGTRARSTEIAQGQLFNARN